MPCVTPGTPLMSTLSNLWWSVSCSWVYDIFQIAYFQGIYFQSSSHPRRGRFPKAPFRWSSSSPHPRYRHGARRARENKGLSWAEWRASYSLASTTFMSTALRRVIATCDVPEALVVILCLERRKGSRRSWACGAVQLKAGKRRRITIKFEEFKGVNAFVNVILSSQIRFADDSLTNVNVNVGTNWPWALGVLGMAGN